MTGWAGMKSAGINRFVYDDFLIHCVPKKISYFALLKPYKVGNFFWDTVYKASFKNKQKTGRGSFIGVI